MSTSRFALLAVPLLLAAGCSQTGTPAHPTAFRFAGALEQADQSVEAAIGRMDAFERVGARESEAVAFAAIEHGRAPRVRARNGAGAVEATGRLLAPVFTALSDYGHVLGQASAGQAIAAKPSPTGAELAADAERALAQIATLTRAPVAAPVRTAGLAGIVALADLPEVLTANRGNVAGAVAQAQPHVLAVVSLLRAALGSSAEEGARRQIREIRLELRRDHDRLLAKVRADRVAGPAERYLAYRLINEVRETDPALGTMSSVYALLQRLEEAHTALAAALEGPDTTAKVAAFETAGAALANLLTTSRSAQPDTN
jgi:hypothetical protein